MAANIAFIEEYFAAQYLHRASCHMSGVTIMLQEEEPTILLGVILPFIKIAN